MNNATSAAIGANLAELGNTAMRMFDPSTRREALLAGNKNALLAAQLSGQNIENQYRPDLFAAQTGAANASAAQAFAGAGKSNAEADIYKIRAKAGNAALNGYTSIPTTSYSQGGAYGPDEMTDPYTEQGYSSTGRNLSPGVVAVNPSVYPIGTVFKDPNGKTFIAADKHGNKDPNVVDMYRLPQEYKAQSGNQQLRVVGQEKIPYGTTAAQLAEMRAKYERQAGLSNIFNGGGANDLMQANARAAALSAGTEEDARRAGLAMTGNGFSAGENFTPARSDAYHAAQLEKDLNVELIKQQGGVQQKALALAFENGGNGSSGTGGASGNPLDARSFSDGQKIQDDAAAISKQVFKVVTDKDGNVTNDPFFKNRMAYSQSVQNLMFDGKTATEAMAIANAHHFGGDPTIQPEDGYISDPSTNWKQDNEIPRTGSQGGGRMPTPFQMALLEQAGINMSDAFTMPPTEAAPQAVGSSQPVVVPQTGVKDAFTRRQGSREKAEADVKKKQISELEGRLRDVTRNLETGNQTLSSPSPFSAAGASRGFMPTQPTAAARVQPMDNDTYNLRLDEYHALNKQLKELKGGAASTDAARLGSVVAKYTQ